jgi:hypothetical protein
MAFVALLVLPLGATQITVWIGQLGLHVVAALIGATALLAGTKPRGREADPGPAVDVAAAALLTVSLVKPTLSVPVVVTILLITGRWRPWLLTGLFYSAASLVAAAFQDASLAALIQMWLGREDVMQLALGSVNTHLWLDWLGVDGSLLAASVIWLIALVSWTWRRRQADPWLLVAVAALVGRLWIHHRAFDDVLLIITLVVLYRVATYAPEARGAVKVAAAVLVALMYALGHAPYAWLSGESPARWLTTEVGRTAAWLTALGFMVWWTDRVTAARRGTGAAHG